MDRKRAETPGTDEWWTKRLMEKLARQGREAAELRQWYEGKPPLPYPDSQKPVYERLQSIARINLASLIVDARLFRLNLTGAKTSVDQSPNGDDILNTIFIEQDAPKKLQDAFRHALAEGRGFIMLTTDGKMRVSDAQHAVVECDADGEVIAALSIYRDDPNDRDVAILARPGYFRVAHKAGNTLLPGRAPMWLMHPDSWEFQDPQQSGVDFVPAYELIPSGGSVIEAHKPTLERINHGILQRMIVIANQAFTQRGLKNILDRDPETGEEYDYDGVFESAPDSLWMLPEGVDVWESKQADLTPILLAVRDDVKYLAAESKTPIYMITPDDANGSAAGAETQREGVIFDVRSIHTAFNGTLRRMLSDLLTLRGEADRAAISGIRPVWEKPNHSSIQERATAANAATQAGIPFRLMLEKFAELEPSEVDEAERMRADDVFAQVAIPAASAEVTP